MSTETGGQRPLERCWMGKTIDRLYIAAETSRVTGIRRSNYSAWEKFAEV